jgi:hypothetical protein
MIPWRAMRPVHLATSYIIAQTAGRVQKLSYTTEL